MCLAGCKFETIEFEKDEIPVEEISDNNLFIYDKNNKPLMRKILSTGPKWDFLIGIAVNMEAETSVDMQHGLEKLDTEINEEENYV